MTRACRCRCCLVDLTLAFFSEATSVSVHVPWISLLPQRDAPCAMAEGASLEILPRQILAKILSPLDSHDLEKVGLVLRDPQIAKEASWEALCEIASRCDSPASALASFNEIAGEPLQLCVDAVRRITETFVTEIEGEGDRAYVVPPAQTVPNIDEPIDSSDYELVSFVGRDFTAYLNNSSVREVREFYHEDMRKWNDMHAEGGFWTKAPGKSDIACWLLFGTPCDHLTRAFAPDSENADREDAFRYLFANATRVCVRVAASAYQDLLEETHQTSRALVVPRVAVVARRLATYGFFEEASALLRAALFDDDNRAVLGPGALTNELYIFLVELRCEAMYAGTFVEPFMGEDNFHTFASTVKLARLVVDRATEDVETEDAVDRTTGPVSDDLARANEGTMEVLRSALAPRRRAELRNRKLRYLEEKKRTIEKHRTESSGRVPETTELSYAHSVDRLAAAQLAYGRILGLAHQQKHMQVDFDDYPEVTAEIVAPFAPTFIWPNHGERVFREKEMHTLAKAAARGSDCIRSVLEDKRRSAVSTAATAEVLYCAASVKINDAVRANDIGFSGDPELARVRHLEAGELSMRSVRCFRDGLRVFDDSQKDLATLMLLQEREERGGACECSNPKDLSSAMQILRLEMGEAVAARGAPLLDASLFVIAKDLGKTLRFVDAHGLADPHVDPDRSEFGIRHGNAHGDGPWVPWELMDENGEPRVGVHVPRWTCAAEGDQWLLLAYACAAEAHGPFHAHATSVERMFETQEPRVTPEEVRTRARAVALGYRADFKRRHAGSLGAQ